MKLKSIKSYAKANLQKLNQQRTSRVPIYTVNQINFNLFILILIFRYFLFLIQQFKFRTHLAKLFLSRLIQIQTISKLLSVNLMIWLILRTITH